MRLTRLSLVAAALTLVLAGCASPGQYFGIPTSQAELAEPLDTVQRTQTLPLSRLARRAQLGDKRAQFELALRFEYGVGIERDLEKACRLYAIAASESGGTIWVYSPPVGNSTTGTVIPVDSGPVVHGLARARKRLDKLEAAGTC